MPLTSELVYSNSGNTAVLELVDRAPGVVLDVGCGSGDLAALLAARDRDSQIYGITASAAEARAAEAYMERCWVADLEAELPGAVGERQYDVLIFSHVLEHTREPQWVLKRTCRLLRPGGTCVIAVPNVMVWRQRWEFLRGRFVYQEHGIMDATHLRFFSYQTAAPFLLAESPELQLDVQRVSGSVPLWILRRRLLPTPIAQRIDRLGCEAWPNLFGGEVLLKCTKRTEAGS